MRQIDNVGNLPAHLQAFARQLGGQLSKAASTEFYEMSSVSEFEKNASEIGYEIVPTVDTTTGRGFLVGFDVTEPQRIATLVDYSTLKIYYIECSDETIKEWIAKIKKHRDMQQAAMYERQEGIRLNRAQRRALKFRGGRS
jgi:hypothetical protein